MDQDYIDYVMDLSLSEGAINDDHFDSFDPYEDEYDVD